MQLGVRTPVAPSCGRSPLSEAPTVPGEVFIRVPTRPSQQTRDVVMTVW
jgi:hypothetical protein